MAVGDDVEGPVDAVTAAMLRRCVVSKGSGVTWIVSPRAVLSPTALETSWLTVEAFGRATLDVVDGRNQHENRIGMIGLTAIHQTVAIGVLNVIRQSVTVRVHRLPRVVQRDVMQSDINGRVCLLHLIRRGGEVEKPGMIGGATARIEER